MKRDRFAITGVGGSCLMNISLHFYATYARKEIPILQLRKGCKVCDISAPTDLRSDLAGFLFLFLFLFFFRLAAGSANDPSFCKGRLCAFPSNTLG